MIGPNTAPIVPEALGPKKIDFTSGYRDSTKGATLKALQQRRADIQGQVEAAMKPRDIDSMWQGGAQLAEVIGGSIREGRAANQEASGRARFAELLAGGLAPDEIGEAMGLDPETTQKYQEHQWTEESDLKKHGWDVDAATERARVEKEAKDAEFAHTDTRDEDKQAHDLELETKREAATLKLADHNASIEEKKEAQRVLDEIAKAKQDAVLRTPQGEREAAVKAGTMTQAQADELNNIDVEKAKGEAADAGPDQWRTPTKEEAAKQGGDVGRTPGSYLYNAKTGEFKPVERARSSTDIANTGKFEIGLANTRSAKTALKKALDLAPNIFEGGGAPGNINIPGTDIGIPEGTGDAIQRAKAILMLPKGTPWVTPELRKQAEDTIAYNNIMSEEAIKSMQETLTGASSNFEMAEFQKIMSNPGTPLATKIAQINRMMAKLDAYELTQTQQVTESGGDPNRGQAAPAPAPAAPAEELSDEDLLKKYGG